MKMTSDVWQAFSDQNSITQVDFDALAKTLMGKLLLNVFGNACQLLEIEFYLQSAKHPDPFVHCDQAQLAFARWYLHRTGGTLKNGSFKGLDLAVGDGRSYFGILIRSLATPDGVVCGPCLCVNYMIEAGGFESIKDLSMAIENLDVRTDENPVQLVSANAPNSASSNSLPEIFSCPRVGLSTKHDSKQHQDFSQRDYRYLMRPRDIKKGRPELIRGLAKKGFGVADIRKLTGSPTRSIEKYSEVS